jgi:hypothetical protein
VSTFGPLILIKVILLSSILRSIPRRLPLSSFLSWLILNSKLFLKNIATPLWLDANELKMHSPCH